MKAKSRITTNLGESFLVNGLDKIKLSQVSELVSGKCQEQNTLGQAWGELIRLLTQSSIIRAWGEHLHNAHST